MGMLMNQLCYFEIQSSQPSREVAFYQAVFGWSFEKVAGLPIDYYRITTTGIHGGLLSRPAATPPTHCGTNAFTCSIEVTDFDATATLILVLVKPRRTLLSENFHTPMDSFHCWLYEAV